MGLLGSCRRRAGCSALEPSRRSVWARVEGEGAWAVGAWQRPSAAPALLSRTGDLCKHYGDTREWGAPPGRCGWPGTGSDPKSARAGCRLQTKAGAL